MQHRPREVVIQDGLSLRQRSAYNRSPGPEPDHQGMETLLAAIRTGFAETLGDMAGSLILLGLFLALATAAFVLLKRLAGSSAQFQVRFESRHGPVAGQPPANPFETVRFAGVEPAGSVDALDAMRHSVAALYVRLLYAAMVLVTGALAFLYWKYPDDSTRAFMMFYGTAAYLVAMVTLSAQVTRTRRRMRPAPAMPGLMEALRSKVQVHVQHTPEIYMIDDSALDRAERVLDAGGTIDEACRELHPSYPTLDPHVKAMVQTAVRASIDKRRDARFH